MLKLPPQNIEAEKSVLGALMIDSTAIIKIADFLQPEDFYKLNHQKIFSAILELFSKSEPIDILSVSSKINELEYLTEIIEETPIASHIEHYAKIVKEKKILRDLLNVSAEINEEVFKEKNIENLLDEVEQKVFNISQCSLPKKFVSLKDELSSAYERIEKLHQKQGALRGITTGFEKLDNYLSGLQKSDFIIVGARPSLGKTAFVLDIARQAALKGKVPVGIFSLEMPKEQVVDRLIAAEAMVNLWRLRTGKLTDQEMEFEMIQKALDRLSKAPIFIEDTPSPTVLQIRSLARRLQIEKGLGLLIIDYVQLIQPMGNSNNPVQQYTEISRNLKGLARELNVPVLAVSQLTRAVDQREIRIPRLSDLRETGCLTGDTLIYNPLTGNQVPMKQLAEKNGIAEKEKVLSINNDWQLVQQPILKAFYSGKKQVFELITRSGRKIKASANHPFRKLNSWVRLDELKIGEKIALPRFIPQPFETIDIDQNKIILLAHLIGDGCYLKRQPLHYTNSEEDLLRIVAQSAKNAFGLEPKWIKQKNWWHIFLTRNTKQKVKSKTNPLIEWLKEISIYNQKSYEKILPKIIFQLNNEDLSLFIRHLWSTDGTIYFNKSSNNWQIFYTSSSHSLLASLQLLFLRFGILTTIGTHKKRGYRDTFDLRIQGSEMQKIFLKQIGIFGKKEVLVEKALKELELIKANPNLDVLPLEIWDTIRQKKNEIGISWRKFSSELGMSYCGSTLFESAPSRNRLLTISKKCLADNLILNNLSQSNVYWDEITSIKSLGIENTYDISVNQPHNFLANGIFVHNSWEQDSDVVLFIYKKFFGDSSVTEQERNLTDIIISKHRNGPLGSVEMVFDDQKVTFREIDKIHSDEAEEN